MDVHEKMKQKSISPPNVVDSSPLLMEKNRESLKIKLMVRRSANQLVEQGILPPLKTSPAIHEQKKLLERAKTGDLLKAKIQQRPNRQELERRHILESHESHIDPSLADKYRMLEKAILVDQLNSKISHRPGPLELIEKNILHANEPIERIVKEGLVPFKASTNDSSLFEEDSQSSEGDINSQSESISLKADKKQQQQQQQQQQHQHQQIQANTTLDTSSTPVNLNLISLNLPLQTNIIAQNSLLSSLTLKVPSISTEHDTITLPCLVPESFASQKIEKSTEAPLISVKTEIVKPPPVPPPPMPQLLQQQQQQQQPQIDGSIKHHISSFIQNNQKISSIGKEKARKKCKIKPNSKIKAIKFHEYKGPPNVKNTTISSNNKKSGETNYELIMQQQCLLEYLEGIYKANPLNNKSDGEFGQEKNSTHEKKFDKSPEETRIDDQQQQQQPKKHFITIFPSKSPASVNMLNGDKDALITDCSKLGKMKVSELKAYLKKLNLPVSGPKPLLIERLKNFLPLKPSEMCKEKISDNNNAEVIAMEHTSSANSLTDTDFDSQSNFNIEENIVKEQQRKIEELQRKLLESQSELEQIKLSQSNEPPLLINSNAENCLSKNDKIFQIIPNANNMQTNVLYDTSKYQMPGKLSTAAVFVVGVAPITASQELSSPSVNSVPMLIHDDDEHEEIKNTENIVEKPLVSDDKYFINTSESKDKNHTFNASNNVQDDINDVLEILLKNAENDNAVINFSDNVVPNLSKIQVDPPTTTTDLCSSYINEASLKPPTDQLEPMSVMTDDVLKRSEYDGNVSNESIINNNDNNINSSLSDFPMEIEENSNTSLNNNDSYKNHENISEQLPPYLRKSLHQDIEDNLFDGFCIDNMTKSNNNSDKLTNGYNGIKNSLIGNFDNGLFDTFKTNIMNSNIINHSPLLNNNFDQHELKANDKFILNNFDVFGNSGIESTVATTTSAPMDFENIISYDIYQHDPFFNNNSSFQSNPESENFSSEMFCEDDHMFDTEKVLKW